MTQRLDEVPSMVDDLVDRPTSEKSEALGFLQRRQEHGVDESRTRPELGPEPDDLGSSGPTGSRSGGFDDDAPVGVFADGTAGHTGLFVQHVVDDLSIRRGHRLERTSHTRRAHLVGNITRELDQRLLATIPVSGDVDAKASLVITQAPLGGDACEILHRIQRPSARTDEQAEFGAGDIELQRRAVDRQLRRAA